jgi:hypothetical protein
VDLLSIIETCTKVERNKGCVLLTVCIPDSFQFLSSPLIKYKLRNKTHCSIFKCGCFFLCKLPDNQEHFSQETHCQTPKVLYVLSRAILYCATYPPKPSPSYPLIPSNPTRLIFMIFVRYIQGIKISTKRITPPIFSREWSPSHRPRQDSIEEPIKEERSWINWIDAIKGRGSER